jgi:cytochrome c-type biogenesis protein
MSEVGVFAAAAAGLLSFLSPCVLPLIPGYLSFVSGYGLADIRSGTARSAVLKRTAAFVAGFTIVFVALGMLFSGASFLLGGLSRTITTVAGAIVVLLGLNLIFDFLTLLDLEARFHSRKAPVGYLGAVLVGVAFAAGWSPCVGPILASILLYASREGGAPRAAILLSAYSLGLALPFLAAALFFDRMSGLMAWFKRHARGVRIVTGILLVLLGASMVLGKLGALSGATARWGAALAGAAQGAPGFLRPIADIISRWLLFQGI